MTRTINPDSTSAIFCSLEECNNLFEPEDGWRLEDKTYCSPEHRDEAMMSELE